MDQSSLAANVPRFLETYSCKKRIENFFLHFLDYISAEGLVFRTNTSSHYGVINSTGRARHVQVSQVIIEKLDHAQRLPEFGVNDKSAVGSSSGTGGDGEGSSGAGVSSS